MKMLKNKKVRSSLLFGTLAVTVLASVVSGHEKPATDLVVAPAERAAAQTASTAQAPVGRPDAIQAEDFDLARLQRGKKDGRIAELFAADAPPASGAGAGTAMVGASAPPAETPLPFQYLGRVIDEGRTSVFLARGDESLVVQKGQNIDGQYRVDDISDASVAFTHLPSGARKVLPIAAQN